MSTPPRSQFVTTLAWIFILLGAIAVLLAFIQNLVVWTLAPEAFADGGASVHAHGVGTLRLLIALPLLLAAITLVAAIGLLYRQGWARYTFLGLFALGILLQLLGVGNAFTLTPPPPPAELAVAEAAELQQQLAAGVSALRGFTVVMALVMLPLLGWLIRRLASPAIGAEFRR